MRRQANETRQTECLTNCKSFPPFPMCHHLRSQQSMPLLEIRSRRLSGWKNRTRNDASTWLTSTCGQSSRPCVPILVSTTWCVESVCLNEMPTVEIRRSYGSAAFFGEERKSG